MKIDTLVKILLSDAEYWILAKQNWARDGMNMREQPDSILFAHIPHKKINSREEIRLVDLETLESQAITCVHLFEKYPPFQAGITLYSIREAEPVIHNIRDVFEACMAANSGNFYTYKEIIDKHNEP